MTPEEMKILDDRELHTCYISGLEYPVAVKKVGEDEYFTCSKHRQEVYTREYIEWYFTFNPNEYIS